MNRRSFLRGLILTPIARAVMAVPFGAALVERVMPATFAEIAAETMRKHAGAVAKNIEAYNALLKLIRSRSA